LIDDLDGYFNSFTLSKHEATFEKFLTYLEAFQARFGHVDIPSRWKVPKSFARPSLPTTCFPPGSEGYPLGFRLTFLRSEGLPMGSSRDRLEAMGILPKEDKVIFA
jgi:hypothetical protein